MSEHQGTENGTEPQVSAEKHTVSWLHHCSEWPLSLKAYNNRKRLMVTLLTDLLRSILNIFEMNRIQ